MKNYLEDLELNNISVESAVSLNYVLNDFAKAGIHGDITFDADEDYPRKVKSNDVEIRIPEELHHKAYDIIEDKYVFTTNIALLNTTDDLMLKGITYNF